MWRNVCARHSRRSSAIGSRFRQYSSRKRSRVANVASERSGCSVTRVIRNGPWAARSMRALSPKYLDRLGFGSVRHAFRYNTALRSLHPSRVLVDSRAIDFMHEAPNGRIALHCGKGITA